MAARKMDNHHALGMIAFTICDPFGVNLADQGLRFFRDHAREKRPLHGGSGKLLGARCIVPLRPQIKDIPFLPKGLF